MSAESRILVIDDDIIIQKHIAQIVAKAQKKYQVIGVSSGKEALDLLNQDPRFDVILLDILMPEMHGIKVLKTLKSNPATADIKVIMLTSISQLEGKASAFSMGAVDYILKPFNNMELLTRLDTQIRLKQAENKLARIEQAPAQQAVSKKDETAQQKQVSTTLFQYTERLAVMRKIYHDILSVQSIDKIVSSAILHLQRLVPFRFAEAVRFNYEAQQLQSLIEEKQNTQAQQQKHLLTFEKIPPTLKEGSIHIGQLPDENLQPLTLQQALQQSGLCNYALIPLIAQGKLIGALSLQAKEDHLLNAEHLEVAQEVANSLAVAISQADLLELTQQHVRFLALLNDITQTSLNATDDLTTMLQAQVDRLRELTNADGCVISLWYKTGNNPYPIQAFSPLTETSCIPGVSPEAIINLAAPLREGKPLWVRDVIADSMKIPDILNGLSQTAVRALIGLPLLLGEQNLGSLVICFQHTRQFTELDKQRWEQIASQIASAISKAQLLESERSRRQEAEMLIDTTRAVVSNLELHQILQGVLANLKKVIAFDSAAVLLENGSRLNIVAKDTPKQDHYADHYPVDELYLWMKETKQPIILGASQAGVDFEIWNNKSSSAQGWMGVPLLMHDEVIGYMMLNSSEKTAFGYQESALAQAFANQVTVALENAQLYTQTHRRAAELETLNEVSAVLRQANSLEEMYPLLMQKTTEIVEAKAGALLILDNDSLNIVNCLGYSDTLIGRKTSDREGLFWKTTLSGEALFIPDLEKQNIPLGQHLYRLLLENVKSVALLPLKTADATVGLMLITHQDRREYSYDEQRMLTTLSGMAGVAIQRATITNTLEQRVTDRTQNLKLLFDVTAAANQLLDLKTMLDQSLQLILNSTGSTTGGIHLLTEGQNSLKLISQSGCPEALTNQIEDLPPDAGLWWWVVDQGDSLIVRQLDQDKRTSPILPDLDFKVFIGVPIRAREQILGALFILDKSTKPYTLEYVALLLTISDEIGIAVERARLRKKAEEAAVMEERRRMSVDLHDSVTQLLYSVALFAETGQNFARSGDWQRVVHYQERLSETAQQALKEMRLLLHDLKPLALEQAGLVGSLRHRLDSVEQRSGVDAKLFADNVDNLPLKIERCIYFVITEALNNALKHANASTVSVQISKYDDMVIASVEDNGVGFDPKVVENLGGMGLSNMRERAQQFDGSLSIRAAGDQGSVVEISLPLTNNNTSANDDLI